MFITKEQEQENLGKIEQGLDFFMNYIGKMYSWCFSTRQFVFGHDDVRMVRGKTDGAAVLILSNENAPASTDADYWEATPHIELIFDNVTGIDNLIYQLQKLRPILLDIADQKKKQCDEETNDNTIV